MKYLFYILITIGIYSCQSTPKADNNLSEPKTELVIQDDDNTAIKQSFEKLKSNPQFLKDLGLDDEDEFRWGDDFMYKVFRGDVDGNGTSDALIAFTIENRGGGNNYDFHYAALLNQNGQWNYAGVMDASLLDEDLIFEVESIENTAIKGQWVGNKDESILPFKADYVVRNGAFVNIYTALHQTKSNQKEGMIVYGFTTKDFQSIPITASLKDYEKLLGKGKVNTPQDQPECGTYWDEGTTRYLDYQYFTFELNDENIAGWMETKPQGSGLILQTNFGTITENITIAEFNQFFKDIKRWSEREDGSIAFYLPEKYDNATIFTFDKNGKLVLIGYWIGC